jgi:integrase/recombinase XerD
MAGPSKVGVSGPLEEFAGGFLAELAGVGYAPRSSEAQLYLMRHLSRWLGARGLAAGDLTAGVVARFVAARRQGTG